MLTDQSAKMVKATRYGAAGALSLIITTLIFSAAYADGMIVGGCIGGGAINCVIRWGEPGDPYVRVVPPPTNEEEKKRSADRDHKWEERCRPMITQDAYGVPRYQYAAPGCEFGVIQ